MAYVTTPTHELYFSARGIPGNTDLLTGGISTMALDADFGNPVPLDKNIPSSLLDGSFVVHLSDGNREIHFQVEVEAETEAEVTRISELTLVRLTGRRGTLTWKPPQPDAPYNVYDVMASRLDFKFDDLDELRYIRTFELILTCHPYPRAAVAVVTPALPVATGSDVTLDNGTSASSGAPVAGTWTNSVGTLSSVASGIAGYGNVIQVAAIPKSAPATLLPDGTYNAGFHVTLSRSFSSPQNFSTTPFLVVDAPTSPLVSDSPAADHGYLELTAAADGVDLTRVSRTTSPVDPTWSRFVFLCSDSSVSTLDFDFSVGINWLNGPPTGAMTTFVQLDSLLRTSVSPSGGSTKYDGVRTIDLQGSVRTPGSLTIKGDATNDLIIHTYGSADLAYNPTLLQWMGAYGSRTSDSNAMTGAYYQFSTISPLVVDIPLNNLPRGGFALLLRMRLHSGSGQCRFDYTTQTRVGGADVGPALTGSSDYLTFTNSYSVVHLGTFQIPTDVPSTTSGFLRLTIDKVNFPGATPDLRFDQGWTLWRGGDGQDPDAPTDVNTTIVRGVKKYTWIDSPDLSNNGRPAIWTGTLADRSDAYHCGYLAAPPAIHQFRPPSPVLYFAAIPRNTSAAAAEVSFEYFARFKHHVLAPPV